ncbi:hypothetical protein FIBSPDRAFT_889836 [Athelia psychrophila]|uniref:Uncharacterized protein n=1 Tax=Athelia psychrophila TaxID=1759441 RepID=A0A166LQH0_9AGAM|nr:hypothetical protein FIBSPDRAFT_889836 [Fibularhizoctonia sp. CBS 109695]
MPENDSGAVIGAGGRAVIDATVTGPGTSNATGTDNRLNNKRTSSTAISDSDSEDRGSGPPKWHWQRKKPNLNTETCTMKVSRRENASGVCGARLPPDEIGKMTRCRSCRAKGRNYKKISDNNIRGVRKHESLRKAGDEDCDEEKGDPARRLWSRTNRASDDSDNADPDGLNDGISANGEYSRTVEITVVRGVDATAIVIHNGCAEGCVVGNNIKLKGMITARI